MAPSRVRLGLVGCGRLAEAGYLPALARVPELALVAVADPDPAACDRVATGAGRVGWSRPSSHRSAAELVARTPVDAVVLASPASTHLDDAAMLSAIGLPVLVEKPPAPDAAGAAALAALDPAPLVAFNRRFDPGAVAARASVPPAGELELLLEIHYRRASWSARTVRDDALLDLGPHLVDWATWLSGSDVVEVSSAQLSHDRCELDLRLGRGHARLRASTGSLHHELIEVRDAGGVLLARHRLGGPVGAVRGRLPWTGPGALVESLAHELQAFARVVRGGDEPQLGTARDGWMVMAVLDAAQRAATSGRAEPINLG